MSFSMHAVLQRGGLHITVYLLVLTDASTREQAEDLRHLDDLQGGGDLACRRSIVAAKE